jgi:VWFA-related protein
MQVNGRGKRAVAFWLCLASFILLLPQSPLRGRQQATISVDVKLINVLATVRDKRGKLISDLGKDDFILDEEGRPQTIRYFSRETDLPLSLGLLVDTSGSTRGVLGQERAASHSFLNDMLRAGKDRAFIIHFDYEVEMFQDLTSSRDLLEQALARLDESQFDPLGGYPRRTRISGTRGNSRLGFGGGGTLFYDAIFLASDEVIRKQLGRKALIVLTDGEDNGSKVSLENAIMTAQRADTVVYSILFTDRPQIPGLFGFAGQRRGGGISPPQLQNTSGRKVLEQISRETGGRMFEVTKKQSIEEIYKIIAEELRHQYSIGYTPTQTDTGPGYRKIHLVTKHKDYVIQARDGYYADQ